MNLDDLFSRTPNKTVFNDLMLNYSVEDIIDVLCDISNNQSDSVASCECGELLGNYYKGTICRFCKTECQINLFGEIRNDSWLAVPMSIKGVLNPQVFRVLDFWIGNTKKRQSILKLILNMRAPIEPIVNTPFYSGMGFNWFYDNFDTVINTFLYNHQTKAKKKLAPTISAFLQQSQDAIWCHYLPILSKFIQPITKMNDNVRYADKDIRELMKAIFTLRSVLIAEQTMKFTNDHIDRNFFKIYSSFLEYLDNILTTKLPRKEGMFRKHVFGSRSHCSARSVATPITNPHDSDEVYIPWKIGVTMYRYHIMSLLEKQYDIPYIQGYNRIMNAVNIYDYTIDKIMQHIVSNCGFTDTNGIFHKLKGLPILVNRNPSLRLGSIQLMYVVRIKPGLKYDPTTMLQTDKIINISHDDDIDIDQSASSYMIISDEKDESNQNELKRLLQRYVEESTISVSPLIVKDPNLD